MLRLVPAAHREQVLKPDDGRVLYLQEVVKLAVGPLGIDQILEGVNDLLDRYHFFILFGDGFVDHPVGALPDFADYFELPVDLVVQFFWLFHQECNK